MLRVLVEMRTFLPTGETEVWTVHGPFSSLRDANEALRALQENVRVDDSHEVGFVLSTLEVS